MNNIHVCHLTTVHSSDDVRIFHKECSSLAFKGFKVTFLSCGNNSFQDSKNGVQRIQLDVPVKNRVQRILKRGKLLYKYALLLDADIYHFHDPELIPIGLKLKRNGKKVIFDSHEDTALLIKTRRWIPRPFRCLLSSIFELYERHAVKKFNAIISVTPSIVRKFKAINQNSFLITNFPGKSEKFNSEVVRSNIAFAGNITYSYRLESVISAIGKTEGINFVLAGKPVSSSYFEKLKSIKGWDKVNYIGTISYSEVSTLYQKSLIGIACHAYTENVGYKEGSLGTLKFFEYMNAGMAIICTDFDIWKKIIEEEKCGICVNPYNIEEISNAIQYLADNPDIARQMGMNGRKAIENKYNWENQAVILYDIYNKILAS